MTARVAREGAGGVAAERDEDSGKGVARTDRQTGHTLLTGAEEESRTEEARRGRAARCEVGDALEGERVLVDGHRRLGTSGRAEPQCAR